jgi:3-deoxy-manno-octulosonate cytidylyltransferase (CMP-KDO synthetase)
MVESGFAIGTAAVRLDPVHQSDRNVVKVTVSRASRAGRFARTLTATDMASGRDEILHHLGVYAYTRAAVLQWVGLPECVEEHTERLEQLRPMANGMSIGVAILDCVAPLAIDTESDLQRARSSQVNIRDQSRKSA